MEPRTVSELKDHFQKILRNAENDPKLVINDAEEVAGSKLGDNYMSIVLRAEVTGKKGNGEPYRKSFMTKHYPRHRAIAEIIRNVDLFKNEAHIYNHLLKHLGNIAPRCYFANQDEIVMENMKAAGYVVQPRKELLDFQHSTAVVQTLARLHARSLSFKLRNPEKFRELVGPLIEVVFPQDKRPALGASIDSSTNIGIAHLSELEAEDETIPPAIAYLKTLQGNAFSTMKELVIPDRGKYDVLTHGDSWNNNFLFKHDPQGSVVDVKLIDFQCARHASAAIDFHYFVYSSARNYVIENHYEDLIEIYHKALVNNLKELKVPEEDVHAMSMDWWRGELNKLAYYGLYTSFWLVQAVLADDDNMINMDDLTPDFLAEIEKVVPPATPLKTQRMRCVTLHFMKKYAGI